MRRETLVCSFCGTDIGTLPADAFEWPWALKVRAKDHLRHCKRITWIERLVWGWLA